MDRRDFLSRTGQALAASALAASCGSEPATAQIPAHDLAAPPAEADWERVRSQFALSDDVIHMSAMLVASHPRPVREAIDRHRRALDRDPTDYLGANGDRLTQAARGAAGGYLGIDGSAVALTDSTTMGVGLVYNGLRLRPGQEILTTEHDFYVTHEALRMAAARSGATVRRIALYDRVAQATEHEIVERIARAITPATRVLAVTWVHSSTGLKLPLRRIGDALDDINADRGRDDRVLFCVDAVHGFGNQDVVLAELGCDLLMTGCHKWLFGPRGTGIVAGRDEAWRRLVPTIPSFIDAPAWQDWWRGSERTDPTTAATMTPGGLKPCEHQWALVEAFAWHRSIGKARIAARTQTLAAQLKDGLAGMTGVTLHTPRSDALSAGIVSFDMEGTTPPAAVKRLRERGVIASVAPYAAPHIRLTPCIYNTPAQIEAALRVVRAIAG
jgi:isopenicillin-N epimerase